MGRTAYVGEHEAYVASGNNQVYLDTGITPNQNFGFEIDFIPKSSTTSTNAPAYINAGGAGGQSYVNQRVGLNVYSATTTPNGEFQFGTFKANNGLTINVRQKFSLKNKVVTFPDGTTETLTISDFTSPNTLFLGCAHQTSGTAAQRFSNFVLYSLKLYDGNTLVRDFVPAYNNSKYCLYDNVTENYFYFNGTTTGFVGNVAKQIDSIYVGVNGVAKEVYKAYVGVNGIAKQFWGTGNRKNVSYIEGTGTQYVQDTTHRIISGNKIKIKFAPQATNIGWGSLFWGGSANSVDFSRYNKTTTWYWKPDGTNTAVQVSLTNGTVHEMECTESYLKLDGTTYSFTPVTYASTTNTTLFKGQNYYVNAKIYEFKIYDANDNLKADLTPVLDANGEPCFYDGTTEYKNLGTGEFSFDY